MVVKTINSVKIGFTNQKVGRRSKTLKDYSLKLPFFPIFTYFCLFLPILPILPIYIQMFSNFYHIIPLESFTDCQWKRTSLFWSKASAFLKF
jgi:hypothetical protein